MKDFRTGGVVALHAIPQGLTVTVRRGCAPSELQPDLPSRAVGREIHPSSFCLPPVRLAVWQSDLEHGSVAKVMSCLWQELSRLGFDVRPLRTGEPLREGECLLTWGHHNLRPALEEARRYPEDCRPPIALIDPIDGWALSGPQIAEKAVYCDVVFGLSKHSCETLVRLGLPAERVKGLRLGVDRNVFYPRPGLRDGERHVLGGLAAQEAERWTNRPGCPPRSFCFLHCGFLGQPRKGTSELVRAFCHAFTARDDVALLIKSNHDGWGRDIREELLDLTSRHAQAPHILYSWARLSQEDMARLYNEVDCIVAPSRLEGFGFVPLEALACGTPIIATDYSGHQEYLTKENARLIAVEERTMPWRLPQIPPEKPVFWGEVDVAVLSKTLRQAHASLIPPAVRGGVVGDSSFCLHPSAFQSAGPRTAREFSWSRAALDVVSGLAEVGIQILRRPRSLVTTPHKTAFIIAAHNCAEDLNRCLTSLAGLAAGAPYEIITVDDGSTDHTGEVLEEWKNLLPITIHRHSQRSGVVASRITGTRALCDIPETSFVCYLDADVFAEDREWLHKLLDAHIDGISVPKLLWADREPGTLWAAGGEWVLPPNYADCRGRGRPDEFPYDHPCEVPFAPGACLFMRRGLLEHIEWDEAYAGYGYEDVDLCLQVTRLCGEHIWYWPHVVLFHRAGSYSRALPDSQPREREFTQSRSHFAQKWLRHERSSP